MLPEITHLQAFIIQLIAKDEHSGRFIRDRLDELGERKSLPAFYQLMSRMEKAGLVSGHYLTAVIDGHTVKERRYSATIDGMEKLIAATQFYSSARRRSGISSVLAEALSTQDCNRPEQHQRN